MDILLKIKNFIKVNYYLTVNSNGPLECEICEGFSRFLKLSKAVFSSEIIKYMGLLQESTTCVTLLK